jgi:soluble lytic murein transglycosylase
VAIALGASYLGNLAARFQGREEVMVAAYNAGEEQAALWLRYCFSQEPEEYLSKVGFRETRAYAQRVLASRAHYAALYADPAR